MDAHEKALEIAVRFAERLLDWLWVVILEGWDDLTEKLQCRKCSIFMYFDEIGDFFKKLFEVILIVVIFDG